MWGYRSTYELNEKRYILYICVMTYFVFFVNSLLRLNRPTTRPTHPRVPSEIHSSMYEKNEFNEKSRNA